MAVNTKLVHKSFYLTNNIVHLRSASFTYGQFYNGLIYIARPSTQYIKYKSNPSLGIRLLLYLIESSTHSAHACCISSIIKLLFLANNKQTNKISYYIFCFLYYSRGSFICVLLYVCVAHINITQRGAPIGILPIINSITSLASYVIVVVFQVGYHDYYYYCYYYY